MGTTVVLQLLLNRIFWEHFGGVQRLGGIYTGRSRLHRPRVNGINMCYFNVYVFFITNVWFLLI